MKALDVGTKAGDFPHLPPGREPGAQSLRTVARRNFLWPFVGFVGAAMFAGGVFVAAGGRGARFDPREEFWGGLVFAAFGFFLIFAALVMREAGRPKRHRRLRGTTLSVAGDGVRRGNEISVSFTGRVRGDRVEVGIACDERVDTELRTYVKGATTVVRQTSEATVHEEWQVVPAGVGEHVFAFRIPADAPYSYEGDCVSYAWRVSTRAVISARVDPRHDEPIWVEA